MPLNPPRPALSNPHTDVHGWAHDWAPGWAGLLPPRRATAAAAGALRCEWLIIGAGFTGLACARRLAELHPDKEIILLEARQLAQGASGRNSGFVVRNSHFPGVFKPELKPEFARVNRINNAGQALLAAVIARHKIACDWQAQGFYHTAADAAARQEHAHFIDYLERLEIAHTPMNRAQLADDLGSDWYHSGVQVPGGALMQPAKLVYGLADSLPPNVRLYENTAVQRIDYQQNFVVRTAAATLTSDKLLLAVNHEAAKLGFLNRRLIGSTLAGSFTRRLSAAELGMLGDKKSWGVLSLHRGGATVRLTADGRIKLRNTAEYRGGKLLSAAALHKRQSIHRAAFVNRFPQLKHVPFEFSWSGVEGVSGDGSNFFQNPRRNLYLAGGYNGSGVSRGSAFGHALAEYASAGQSALITDCLNGDGAGGNSAGGNGAGNGAGGRWLPPRPLLDIGAWFTIKKRFKGVGNDL